MKKFFKHLVYSLIISSIFLSVAGSYVSNKLVNELEQMSQIHYENNYLTDAAIICMQLFLLNPTQENKKTCIKIEEKIVHNQKELNNFTFASLYLNYLEKN